MLENNITISCQNVWKVFGPDPSSVIENVDNGTTKQEVLEQTGHVIAVKDVSFDIRENEIFVVMGLSGSGKSTLVRCINRLIEPTRGKIFLDGEDLSLMNEKQLRELRRHKLSMVFQYFGLLPHRSVEDNVVFGLEIRGEHGKGKEEKVAQAIEQVGLKGWETSHLHELSGGMQQRVGLARALAVGTEVLLMDEPFSALDPLIRRQMQDEFINLRGTVKKTVVFITHDLMEALKLGDRVAIMKDGEIVQIGTPQEIVNEPADDYVSEFVKDVPRGQVISVKSVMERPAVVVTLERSLEDTLTTLQQKEATAGYIVDDSRKYLGTVSTSDVEAAIEGGATQVSELVNLDSPCCLPTATLDECLQLVAEHENPLAVVNDRGYLMGIATKTALIQAMRADTGDGN
jgi:glycine betaine/proline transport system ATP-binding protein